MSQGLDHYVAVLNATNGANIDRLVACFSDDARFRDPFSDVRGKAKIRRVFEKTYDDVDDVVFQVTDQASGQDAHYLRWTFTCLPKGFLRRQGPLVIHGMAEIHLNDTGLVTAHLDYWDPAPGLYQRIPILGLALRKLRRQIGVR
ncbi:MAG: nuclear transport factor 2 family protein [Geminicoccaceae bacterium]|nr:MAG: nuclear transport factor 2 family protein [Geminicoccaceae bacterium]